MALKKAIKKSGALSPLFNVQDYEKMANQYAALSAQIKELNSQKKELSEKLKEGAETLGVQDDTGSFYLDCDSFIVGKVAKNSISYDDEKAVELFDSKGLKGLYTAKRIIKYTLKEDAIEKAISTGKLTNDDISKFVDNKVSYAVSVVAKEEMPEVEQKTLSAAKRKK